MTTTRSRVPSARRAPLRVSAGSPTRRSKVLGSAASARPDGFVSAPTTPTGRGASSLNMLHRVPTSRLTSGNAVAARPQRAAPPRRMSTRLQLTLREQLRSRRRLSAQTPAEGDEDADEHDQVGDDDDDDHEDSDSDSDSDSDPEHFSSTDGSSSSTAGIQHDAPAGRARTSLARSKTGASMRRRERKRKRRHRRWMLAALQGLVAFYYLFSVPLRVGLFFDPFFTEPHSGWTRALTVFITLDAISDVCGLVLLFLKRQKEHQRRERQARADLPASEEDEAFEHHEKKLERWAKTKLCISFAVDVVAYFPVEIVLLATTQFNALHIARVTKVLTLPSVPLAFRDFILTSRTRYAASDVLRRVLGRFLLTMVMVGLVWVHWSALIYNLIAHWECGMDLTRTLDCASWAVDDQLRGVSNGGGGGSKFRAYSRAVYWASRTVITLGFSDVVANPSRSTETFFTIIAEFAGAFWCACVIAGFAYWFTLQHRRGSKYSHDMFVHRVEHLLGRTHFGHNSAEEDHALGSVVPEFLRTQIVAFLRYQWAHTQSFGETECRAIVRQEQLQQGLRCEMKTTKLLRLPCFSRQSLGFLNALAGEMKLVSLAPLDWVIEFPGSQSVFFVVISGSVAVVSPRDGNQKVYTCNTGDYFGVLTLFDETALNEAAFAEDYTEVLVLNSEGLERVLETYYHTKESTASQQRDEMRKAALEDYAAFTERCRRRRDRQSRAAQQNENATSTAVPYRDSMQIAMELAPRVWQNAQSTFRVWWEGVRCFALLYLTFEVPYIVVFYYGGNSWSYFGSGGDWRFVSTFVFSALVEVFFSVDLYFRCRSFQPRKNMKSLTFYLDTVANLPLALIVDIYDGCTRGPLPHGWQWLTLFRLIRLLRVRRLKKRVVATLPRATGIAQFIIYCAISILVYCHAVACIWFLAGHYSLHEPSFQISTLSSSLPSKPDCLRMAQQHGNCTWTVMDGMESYYESGDHRFVFLRSLYFSISTFTTVAYGDILPYNTAETWIAASATYVGGVLCYAMFGAMGAAIARLARRRRETRYENHLRARVLEMNGVSRRIRSEINRFQTFRAKTLADHELEQELLAYLSPGLRGELSKCLHLREAQQLAFIQGAKPAFCDAVASRMTRRFYFAGDTIYSAGELVKEAMVIRRGRVQLVDGDSHLVAAVLADGATLGERSFVMQSDPLVVDYVAETVTEVSVLSREALVELWKHFPAEMRRMTNEEEEDTDHVRKYLPMSSTSTYDLTQALPRILVRQDSRVKIGGAEFEESIRWQRAINGNTFRSRWEVLIGTVVVYNTFSIIARVAFVPDPSRSAMVALTTIDYIFDLALLVDIYLKSFHFLAPDHMLSVSTRIFTPKQIRSHYYREGWMVYDLVASLPLYYVGHHYAAMTYCRIPRLLRALQLVEIGERVHAGLLQRWTASSSSAGVAYSLLGLSKVMMVLLICCHIGGSVWYAASSHESENSGRPAWIRNDVVTTQHPGNIGVAYLRSFYWAISTFTVVNYGDIVATTVRETLWACVVCLFGTFFMSKVVSDLVDLLQSLDQCATEHRERVEQFEYVAQRRDLPDDLTQRGQVYLNYEFEVSHGLPAPETLFCSLPRELQSLVYDEMYGSILRRVPLFESLTDMQIRELAAAPWRTDLFLPNDIIVYESSLADSLFVMKQGRAEVVRFKSGVSITQIESGELFGEAMFFMGDEDQKDGRGPRRLVSVRALSFCEVLRLDRDAWLRFMAMRTSNREAGRRVLEIAKGELLKSRAVLQKLESNLELDSSSNSSSSSSDSDSSSSDTERDAVLESIAEISNRETFMVPAVRRELRVESAPALQHGSSSSEGIAPMRRAGSTPAILFSQLMRKLSFNPRSRRPSSGYVALSTPVENEPVSPEPEPRRAKSTHNVLRRFESSPLVQDRIAEGQDGGTSDETLSAHEAKPVQFVDTSVFCYRWDAVKFFAILYYVAALPLRVSYYDDIERAAQQTFGNGDRVMTIWTVLDYVFIDGFLWMDIFMRLFVFVPTVRGEPLTSRSERRSWYIHHGSFLIDVLGSFPLEILTLLPVDAFHDGTQRSGIVAAAFRLTTLVRCFQLEPLWWRLERQLFCFQKDTLTVLKIAFVGVLSSHWIACLWYYVGNASMDSNPLSWLTAPGMLALNPTGSSAPLTSEEVDDVSMLNKYLRSYHYAIGSISTTTYGDISSRNVVETISQLFITFLCIVFYGYVTSGVRQILSRKFARTIALEQEETKIHGFAQHYGLSRALTAAIRSHLRERWRQESDVDQKAVAELIHGPLRREIAAYLRTALFETEEPRRLAFEDLPEVVVNTILAELREEAYMEDEIIYEQYAVGSVMYFVESGTVRLTTTVRDQPPLKSVKKQGEYFGESCVVDRGVNGSERRATAVAETECRLVVLDAEAFERVLALFPTYAATIRAAWSSQTTFAV